MKIITLSGKARSGKDEVGNIMKTLLPNSVTIAYADYLKLIAEKYFGYKGDKYKSDPEQRKILQTIGTDVVRKRNPDFWINIVANFIEVFDDMFDYVIITDARFKNELNILKDKYKVYNILVRSNRSTIVGKEAEHISEHDVDDAEFDYIIDNNSDLKRLHEEVEDVLNFIY